MKILVAAVQMPAELLQIAANLERADIALGEASQAGAELAVRPEMFNTGYRLLPDFGPAAEGTEGPTLRHLSGRSRQWRMGKVAGFVERDRRHLYDALAICLPDGSIQIYRKRHLVFWERFRFHPGRSSLIVPSPWGRIGLAICADMIYRNVWDGYRGQIDLGVIASACPTSPVATADASTGCSVALVPCRPRSRSRSHVTWAFRSSVSISAARPARRSRYSACG